MTAESQSRFLDDQLRLLVSCFGAGAVTTAIERVTAASRSQPIPSATIHRPPREQSPNRALTRTIEQLAATDPAKAEILSGLYTRLLTRTVLPAAEDFRHIAHRIGIKHLVGTTRAELVNALIRFLLEQPADRVRRAAEIAPEISEEERGRAYAILTEGLLGPPPTRPRTP